MANVKVYNQEGQTVEEMELNPAHFGVSVDAGLVHEVYVGQLASRRHPVAHTKTKGMVRGGGKKPWKQKGTGRARQGSTRSPQWVGGGIAFGPNIERNYEKKINRKVRQKALFMTLSDKVKQDRFVVLNGFQTSDIKTKHVAELIKKLPIDRNALLVLPISDPAVLRMARNIPNVQLTSVQSLSLTDVLSHRTVVFWKDAIPAFELLYQRAD